MRFSVQVKGLAALQKQIETASEKVKEVCTQEVQAAGQDWVAGAVRDAPVDQGALKGSISFKQSDTHTAQGSLISVEIVAQKFYAPFVEFGTKGRYTPIPGTEEIAAQFKDYKGGDIKEMKKSIERWIVRKGIHVDGLQQAFGKDQEQFLSLTERNKARKKRGLKRITKKSALETMVFLIVRAILKNGVQPHPFFFKQGDTIWPELIKRMQSKLEKQTKTSVIPTGGIGRPNYGTI
jgi:hypothetical protein